MSSPEQIQQNTDAILRAKQAIELAEGAHARLDGQKEVIDRLTGKVEEIADTQQNLAEAVMTLVHRMERWITRTEKDIEPAIKKMERDAARAKDRRTWAVDQVLLFGKIASALLAVGGLGSGLIWLLRTAAFG